ncbi:MAG: ABC-F family ATP-binding cassette domain-containing protein [Anaerolineales bacterium]|nr:ABC-F family ATP-binding cassette domain-containing protein [Anaerolineales bacterium]
MLSAHHLHKSYNIHSILLDVSFNLNPGERVGLIGPNGCGKTTLLRILAGMETPDLGLVTRIPPDLQIGYLSQGFEADPGRTVAETIRLATGDSQAAEAEVERLALALSKEPGRPDLSIDYDTAVQRLQELSRVGSGRTALILAALGLAELNDESLVSTLSGGQKTRLSLALVLLGDPQLLLLDEPTNHLDIEMLEWLEGWLLDYPGAALIVSHDRTFLDHTVNRILDLDPETHTIREYVGNYSTYLEQYQAEAEKRNRAYSDQLDEIRRMKRDIARTKQQALHVEMTTTSRQPGMRRIAKKVAKKAASREKKLVRYLDSDERLEKPRQSWQMKANFLSVGDRATQHLSQDALVLEELAVGYPGRDVLLRDINLRVRAGRRIALTGPNGAGKTSLLRTIAGQISPRVGKVRLGASVRLGYMAQEQELLDPGRTALEIIQNAAPLNETEARSFLHYFLFSGDDPLRPSGQLSYGERSRLSLAVLVTRGCNLLLLDEPINHLDIPSRSRFEEALAQFNGTVLAVVHDRYFIERFAEEIWRVGEGGISVRLV